MYLIRVMVKFISDGPVAQWIEQFRPKEKVASSTLARITNASPSVHPRVLHWDSTRCRAKKFAIPPSAPADKTGGIYAVLLPGSPIKKLPIYGSFLICMATYSSTFDEQSHR